ncbi:hypothetical protein ASPCAL09036 [Aspergillus calidoustus]|uniref:Uncharacterized protein n=1 Tax=Aspergillus calidoustus TaxID=454130 RepID=A0A0U5GVG1_ASPCI|nr:hypothetical protein ASPCAL09036 [Aspergillus calidoustus]
MLQREEAPSRNPARPSRVNHQGIQTQTILAYTQISNSHSYNARDGGSLITHWDPGNAPPRDHPLMEKW